MGLTLQDEVCNLHDQLHFDRLFTEIEARGSKNVMLEQDIMQLPVELLELVYGWTTASAFACIRHYIQCVQ